MARQFIFTGRIPLPTGASAEARAVVALEEHMSAVVEFIGNRTGHRVEISHDVKSPTGPRRPKEAPAEPAPAPEANGEFEPPPAAAQPSVAEQAKAAAEQLRRHTRSKAAE